MPDFHEIQKRFATDIRTGGDVEFSNNPRMKVYRELFFNNVCGFLDNTFPVCADILGESQWRIICRDFFRDHACHTPLFLKIPEEFLLWVTTASDYFDDYPYIPELAHYEWLELAVDVMPTSEPEAYLREGDFINERPVFTSALIVANYQYPVHRASIENTQLALEATSLIVFRNSEDKVSFIHCNELASSLLDILRSSTQTGLDGITEVLKRFELEVNEVGLAGGAQILSDWHHQGLILGAAKAV